MRLAHPMLLLLLLLIPPLLWLRYRLGRSRSVQHSSGALLATLPAGWRLHIQPLLPICYTVGMVALVVALARPQRGLDNSIVRTEAVDMILLIDLSESMDTRDFAGLGKRVSRLDASKDVIGRFLENRPNDRIGMIGFAALPYAVAPLTLDHGWLIKRMGGLHTGMLDGRRTAIGDGIASAINRLRGSEAKSKVVILLTDGASNAGTLSPENAAAAAAALGIKIYTIGAGGVHSGFFVPSSEVDEDTLKKIADITGAHFYRARDLDSLEAVYTKIDQLEKTEIEVERFTRYQETAPNWILVGVSLLGLEQLLSLSRLGRLP